MINFLNSWTRNIGLAIILVSIFEMLLPNNKMKNYIKIIMGIFIIFNIIAPVVENKNLFNINEFEKIAKADNMKSDSKLSINQKSMNERIKDLYENELEKNILLKIEEKNIEVKKCEVVATLNDDDEIEVSKIKINIKSDNKKKEVSIVNKILIEEYGVSEKCLEIN